MTTTHKAFGSRVDLLEEGFKNLTSALTEMRAEMKSERKEIAEAFAGLRSELGSIGSKARPFPFKEVSSAILSTLAIAGVLVGIANWWFDARTAVVNQSVSELVRLVDPGKQAVLEYRLSQMEARLASK